VAGEDMGEREHVEAEKEKLLHDLNERVKELTVLHHTARLLQHHHKTPSVLLQEIVTLLPAAFDQAEIAAARIVFEGVEYQSTNSGASPWAESAYFTTASGKQGLVEIAYAQNMLTQNERPFLAEEKSLLESIAEMLQLYLDRKEAQESLEQITRELVERNKELWNLQQELGRVEQRAALGWMTGAIAHELGTPLNSVLGYTQLLSQENLPEKVRPHVKIITSQVQRMAGIVQYYLDRTRGSTAQRSPVILNDLIGETIGWVKSVFAEKNIRVTANLEESLPLVNAHAGSLQRVMINLLNNAVASIRDGGEIIITTRRAPVPERGRPGVNIIVTDTGAGLPSDVLPRVFDVFMTTRPPGSGTGLGLPVSQEIIKEHGGKITIDSQAGRGTTVTIFLPTGSLPSGVS
jgi:signal transduction histidine kinase